MACHLVGAKSIRTLETNLSEILSEIHTFSFKKMYLKMPSAKKADNLSRPQYVEIVSPHTKRDIGLYIVYISRCLNKRVQMMLLRIWKQRVTIMNRSRSLISHTVYPKKYAHGFVLLCFVVVMQSFIMNSHEVFIHIHRGCFAGTGAIVRLPQCQWSKPDGYGKISQCITTTKHSKAKTVCIFLGVYCICVDKPVQCWSR